MYHHPLDLNAVLHVIGPALELVAILVGRFRGFQRDRKGGD